MIFILPLYFSKNGIARGGRRMRLRLLNEQWLSFKRVCFLLILFDLENSMSEVSLAERKIGPD